MEECAEASLILLVAPAGFGKTTAMLTLYDKFKEAGVRAGWVHFSLNDNNLERFHTLVSEACQIGEPATEDVGHPSADAQFTRQTLALDLADRIGRLDQPTSLFLDDCERLTDPEVLDALQRMIDSLPAGCRVFIASRSIPALKLYRWKVQGRLLAIGIPELSFGKDQAEAFLNQRHNLCLDEESVQTLLRNTEGWPAGLQLAALALGSQPDKKGFIQNFKGSTPDVGEYLQEEVFSNQPPEIKAFLLQTSLLPQLNALLCDAVTGRSDSAAMLRRLEQKNLFIVRVGDAGTDYRYHPLFLEFLVRRLQEEDPDLAPRLHERAARWFYDHGYPNTAINSALASGNHELSCSLLREHAWITLAAGFVSTTRNWLISLPQTTLDAHPDLLVVLGWCYMLEHDFRLALETTCKLEHEPAVRSHDLFRVLQLDLLAHLDRIKECEAAVAACVKTELHQHLAAGVLCNIQTYLSLCNLRFGEVAAFAAQARVHYQHVDSTYAPAFPIAFQAYAHFIQGQPRQMMGILEPAFEETVRVSGRHHVTSALYAVYLAEGLYEAGEHGRAGELMTEMLDLVSLSGLVDLLIICHRVLARAQGRAGRHQEAQRIVTRGSALGRRLGLGRVEASMNLELLFQQIERSDRGEGGPLDLSLAEHPAWAAFTDRLPPANDTENPDVFRLRVWLRTGRARQAAEEIPDLIRQAEALSRRRLQAKLGLLLAQALKREGRQSEALEALSGQAMLEGLEESPAIFLDEGPAALALVQELAGSRNPDWARKGQRWWARLEQVVGKVPLAPAPVPTKAEPAPPPLVEPLSEREMQIWKCLAAGLPNNRIAHHLFISEATVKFHLRNIFSKLDARNRTHAVFIGRQHGWME
jgi:LuxR family maltose regulon positive regulatory protein